MTAHYKNKKNKKKQNLRRRRILQVPPPTQPRRPKILHRRALPLRLPVARTTRLVRQVLPLATAAVIPRRRLQALRAAGVHGVAPVVRVCLLGEALPGVAGVAGAGVAFEEGMWGGGAGGGLVG